MESTAKILSFTIAQGENVKIKFTGISAALISVVTNDSAGYACYIAQGYGHTAARMHVATIQTGSKVSYSISDTEAAVTINNNSAGILKGAVVPITGLVSI